MKCRQFSTLPAALVLLMIGIFTYFAWLLTLDLHGTFHNSASLADLDADGDLDVVVQNVRNEAEFTAFAVTTLWLNQGDGTFEAHRLDESGWDSAVGDIDSDGDMDLLVFEGYRLRVEFNQGGTQQGTIGEFGGSRIINLPKRDGQFGSLLLGDLNNDSQIDGVVVGCCSRLFTIDPDVSIPNFSWQWMNTNTTSANLESGLSVVSALDGLAIPAASLGDLDRDGDLDLFAIVMPVPQGQNSASDDRILFNDGAGTFTDSGQRLGELDGTAVSLGDVDRDGDLDALVGHENGAALWINQGGAQSGTEGLFSLSARSLISRNTTAVFLADLDYDDDMDALVVSPKQAVIWWNDGQATFTKSYQRFHFTNRHALAIGDFNADGFMDIFAAEYYKNYRVWYNNGNGSFRTRP